MESRLRVISLFFFLIDIAVEFYTLEIESIAEILLRIFQQRFWQKKRKIEDSFPSFHVKNFAFLKTTGVRTFGSTGSWFIKNQVK